MMINTEPLCYLHSQPVFTLPTLKRTELVQDPLCNIHACFNKPCLRLTDITTTMQQHIVSHQHTLYY